MGRMLIDCRCCCAFITLLTSFKFAREKYLFWRPVHSRVNHDRVTHSFVTWRACDEDPVFVARKRNKIFLFRQKISKLKGKSKSAPWHRHIIIIRIKPSTMLESFKLCVLFLFEDEVAFALTSSATTTSIKSTVQGSHMQLG